MAEKLSRGYQLIIDCEQENGIVKRLYLDTCMEKNITSSAEIAQQPLQSGRTISDHMYSLPDTYSISGIFSLYGNIHDDYDDFEGVAPSMDRLTNIENVFEYIKDHGLLCNLMMIDEDNDGGKTVRFKERNSMALKSITWREKLSSVEYTLNFSELLTVDLQNPDVELEDYPSIIMPSSRSLGQLMVEMNNDDITKIILLSLYQNGYIYKHDLEYFWNIGNEIGYSTTTVLSAMGVTALAAVGAFAVGMAGALTVGAIGVYLGITASAASVFPVGTIIAVGMAVIAGIWACIAYSYNRAEEERKRKLAFNLVNGIQSYITKDANGDSHIDVDKALKNCSINQEEVAKLMRLISEARTAIVAAVDNVAVYSISADKDDNAPRTVVINIANNTYYINITKDEGSPYGWRFQVATLNSVGDLVSLDGTNGICYNNTAVVTDLKNCSINENCFFCDATYQQFVYIFNASLNPEIANSSEEEQDAVKNYLCGYQIIVCDGDLQDEMNKITTAIDDVLKTRGYI